LKYGPSEHEAGISLLYYYENINYKVTNVLGVAQKPWTDKKAKQMLPYHTVTSNVPFILTSKSLMTYIYVVPQH